VHIREDVRAVMSPMWIAAIELYVLTPAREAMDKKTASTAWANGLMLAPEQAIAYALHPVPGIDKGVHPEFIDPLALSRREQAIATLVADGLTNRQIATKLFISRRTVETHVQHIFNKLGVNSRASIAAWAVGQRLLVPGPTAPFGAGV
jgi:non-specific serine/threonine protein kinase